MRRIDIMKRAARNLRQAKGRTFLTSLAIAVGAFTLTLSLAAGEGARQYADNLLKNNIDPQALFIVKDENITKSGPSSALQEYSDDLGTTSSASGRGVTIKKVTSDDITKLLARDDLAQVVPIYQFSAQYVRFSGFEKKYVAPVGYYDASTVQPVAKGAVPKLGEQIKDDEVLIPEEYLETLQVSADQMLGKQVTMTFSQATATPTADEIRQAFLSGGNQAVQDLIKPKLKDYKFTIRAVIKKSTMSITSSPKLQVSTGSAKAISEYVTAGTSEDGKYFGVTALAKPGVDPISVKDSLQKEGFTVQTAKDAQGLLFTFVDILQGIVIGFAMLALIASVFGIINTQYISVLERTSQIGLMKALGMSRSAVAKLFRYEAAWIGFLGGALGVGLALLVGLVANPWITKTLDLGTNMLLIFVWWQIIVLMASLVMIAIVAGWFPSRKAAKLDPIEALRTE